MTATGTAQWEALLSGIASGAKDRDLNDETPFDQVAQLKRADFGTLRLPRELGGAGLTVPQLFSAVIDVARADPIVAHIFRTLVVPADRAGVRLADDWAGFGQRRTGTGTTTGATSAPSPSAMRSPTRPG